MVEVVYLECEVSAGERDGVEVDARLQVVSTQHGNGLGQGRLHTHKGYTHQQLANDILCPFYISFMIFILSSHFKCST